MLRLCLFAAVAGLTLVSASPPSNPSASAAASSYPPCSRTVTDRCIQTRDRNLASAAKAAPAPAVKAAAVPAPAAAPTKVAKADYPACSATVRDRCNQLGHAKPVRLASYHRVRRAGERG